MLNVILLAHLKSIVCLSEHYLIIGVYSGENFHKSVRLGVMQLGAVADLVTWSIFALAKRCPSYPLFALSLYLSLAAWLSIEPPIKLSSKTIYQSAEREREREREHASTKNYYVNGDDDGNGTTYEIALHLARARSVSWWSFKAYYH